MKKTNGDRLLKHLIHLCEEISMGQYGKNEEIFEMTKERCYPSLVCKLAEAFGMMMVKVEAREYRLEMIIEDLKKVKDDLSAAKERLAKENISLQQNLRTKFATSMILGTSPQITNILKLVKKVAGTTANVLITGETGTGKELIAKAIHYNSPRCKNPFVALNCSAIPETIFESEIFGIEKGVATGVEKRAGKIEQADSGTLFLDEIGDMSLSCQAKILRVMEEHQFERVGGRKVIFSDIRLVAATNKDLRKEVEKGTFREDLFYRINVVPVHLPPLRERKDDIKLLAVNFLEQNVRKLGRDAIRFSKDALDVLMNYSWPGNVRELENEVERAATLSYSNTIIVDDLSEHIVHSGDTEKTTDIFFARENEKILIRKALHASAGNKSETARLLGISREGLRKKLKRYGIA